MQWFSRGLPATTLVAANVETSQCIVDAGGGPGRTGRNSITHAAGASETLAATIDLAVEPGD